MRFIENGVDIPDELLRAQDDGHVVFFCGAGVSLAKASLPDFTKLTSQVLDNLGASERSDARRLHTASAEIQNQYGVRGLATSDRVFGLMRREFDEMQIGTAVALALKSPSPPNLSAHKTLLKLARLRTGETRLVTTNFDRLFEAAGKGLKTATRSTLPHIAFNSFDWGIVHLHGVVLPDYSGPTADGFVLSAAEFGDAYLAQGWARNFVREVLDRYVAVFVGYSADDPPVRYLLEGLKQSGGPRSRAFAFQSVPDDESITAWREKDVTAIPFDICGPSGYDILWDSLDEWAKRSADPARWRARVLSKARKGPGRMKPHERGMVAHIVSSADGAFAFAKESPPLPAEWLCVFDPVVRFGEPGRTKAGGGPDESLADPQERYRIDSDPLREAGGRTSSLNSAYPGGAWSALEPTAIDREELEVRQVGLLRGQFARNPARLPVRLSHLASWIARVSDQPACAWWAARQLSLHPEVLRYLKINHQAAQSENLQDVVAAVWRAIFEYHRLLRDEDAEYRELSFQFTAIGSAEAQAAEYAALYAPFLDIEAYGSTDVPPEGNAQLDLRNYIRLDVDYPEHIRTVPVSDSYLPLLIPKLRPALEQASDLQARYSYDSDICSIEEDEKREDEGDDDFARSWKLSGHALHFAGLFRRYAAIDPKGAGRELASWRCDVPVFARLKTWALGNLSIAPAAEFAEHLLAENDDGFWPEEGERDLLLGLAKRWSEFSTEARRRLGQRILAGPEVTDLVVYPRGSERSAHAALNRIHWLAKQGCAFEFDLDEESRRLRQAAPKWRIEYADRAAMAMDGRGGTVRQDTDFSQIENLEASVIIPFVLGLERRPFDKLVEYDPFAGLSQAKPELALAALVSDPSAQPFPGEFWQTFLSRDSRRRDDGILAAKIAAALLALSSEDFARIILTASIWFEDAAKLGLFAGNQKLFGTLWKKFIDCLNAHSGVGSSIVGRQNGEPDWSSEAINSPAGNLAGLLVAEILSETKELESGLSGDWTVRAEELLVLPGNSRRFALVIFGFHLERLYALDPNWTGEWLVGVLEESRQPADDAEAVWAGFFWRGKVPHLILFTRIKPLLIARALRASAEDVRQNEVLAGILLAAWKTLQPGNDVRLVSSAEMRSLLIEANEGFRHQILWALRRWSGSTEWDSQLPEFLRHAWPKQMAVRTQRISEDLVELALAQNHGFPEVAALVSGLVSKLEGGSAYFRFASAGTVPEAARFPEALLQLLFATLHKQRSRWPYGAAEALAMAGEAEPRLRTDARFIALNAASF